jgi:hypothetical protein
MTPYQQAESDLSALINEPALTDEEFIQGIDTWSKKHETVIAKHLIIKAFCDLRYQRDMVIKIAGVTPDTVTGFSRFPASGTFLEIVELEATEGQNS